MHDSAPSLYERDFALWAQQQSAALRTGRFMQVDAANVAEELDGLAASDRRALRSHMRNLILHILKLKYQPAMASSSWKSSILNASSEIEDLLTDSPSLRTAMTAIGAKAYAQARKLASNETGLPLTTFSKTMTPELVQAVADALAMSDLDSDAF